MKKSLLMFFSVLYTGFLMAQIPANDKCSGAIELTVYASEDEAVPVAGDTRNTTDALADNIPVCSSNFFRDDVWYKFTTPADPIESPFAVRVYYNEQSGDIPGFGYAVYTSCDATPENAALVCGNTPGDDEALICLGPNQTVFVRIWSAAGDATDWTTGWGTFRIAVYPRKIESTQEATVLWGDEPGQGDFNGGIAPWTTEGLLCNGTPGENAVWTWTANGRSFYFWNDGVSPIKSKSLCNGAAIFDSGFMEFGEAGTAGSGSCPWDDHEGQITSPVIDMTPFSVAGVSVLFNQAMERFVGGEHFVEYTTDGGVTWESIQINTEKTYLSTNPETGLGYYNEEYRVRLPGAELADSLQIRFRFFGGAYWWVVDDVRLIETECTNTSLDGRVDPWWTIAPWSKIPANQTFSFPVLADVFNAGACEQTNVDLNYTVASVGGANVFDETIRYDILAADSLSENRLFTGLVTVPSGMETSYAAAFTLSQDMPDFDPSDNVKLDTFHVGGNEFALEDEATSPISPAVGNWNAGANKSWAYGNYFLPVVDAEVVHIAWGVSNPDIMEGFTVNVVLYQWTDTNGDDVCSFTERRYVGVAEYTFTGDEVPGGMINTVLENIDDPGAPIVMVAGLGYIAIVEQQALSVDDPVLSLMGSDARAYEPTIFAFAEAFDDGLIDHKWHSSILSIPEDGSLAQVDYGANRFNGDWVPQVRIAVDVKSSTDEQLSDDNLITAFPNPAKDNVQVKLEFAEAFSDVQLRLMDNLGRVVYTKAIEQTISQHIESINVRDLAAGSYMLQIETPAGQRAVPVMVIK